MGKIVKSASMSFVRAGLSAISIDPTKFKAPAKKSGEVSATTLGAIAKRRLPGRLDYDGCTFSVFGPDTTLRNAAGSTGCLAISTIFTDGSKGYWAALGSFSVEDSEIDVEGDALPALDCSVSIDGSASRTAIYGPALAPAGTASTTSALTLSGTHSALVVLSRPAITTTTIAISGQTVVVPAGAVKASAPIPLSGVASTLSATVQSGSVASGTTFAVILNPA